MLLGMLDRPAEPQARRAAGHPDPRPDRLRGQRLCAERARGICSICGYRVLRLNLRGCGASRPHCREHYHVGRTADFRRVLSQLPDDLTDNGIAAVGYSLGGAMLLKYLGEEGCVLAAASRRPRSARRSTSRAPAST